MNSASSPKPLFICQIPASFFQNQKLSIEARGLFGLLVSVADAKTGLIPSKNRPNITPKHLEGMAGISQRTRLRLEAELEKAGFLWIEYEVKTIPRKYGTGVRPVRGRKIYHVKTQQSSIVPKSTNGLRQSQCFQTTPCTPGRLLPLSAVSALGHVRSKNTNQNSPAKTAKSETLG